MSENQVIVIIPAWNAATTLPRQLAALNGQTDLDFDVLVSDNGSTDKTRTVAEEWQPAFRSLKVIDSSGVQGVAHARNVAVRATQHPMILICDADDAVHPTWVEAHRQVLRTSNAATGPLHLVFPDRPGSDGEVWNKTEVPISMNYLPYMPGCNMALHRTVFDAVGGFDESLATGQEDVDFGWKLSQAGFNIAHHIDASIDYFQRSGLKSYLHQQWRYGRAHVQLYLRHSSVGITTASWKSSLRWFLEWAKQAPGKLRRGETPQLLGPLVFQVARCTESIRHSTRTPL